MYTVFVKTVKGVCTCSVFIKTSHRFCTHVHRCFIFFIYIYFYEDVMKVLCVHCFCEDGEDFVCTLLMKTA